MICILVTGIPASGKSALAEFLSKRLALPMMSKDKIKELLFDTVGFQSRAEKVALGNGSMEILYYFAEQMMKLNKPFILENNFERSSKEGIERLLAQYGYQALTLCLTGNYEVIYRRYAERNTAPERHRGHVLNSCYPEPEGVHAMPAPPTLEQFVSSIQARGMTDFSVGGKRLEIDTSDFGKVDYEKIAIWVEQELRQAAKLA